MEFTLGVLVGFCVILLVALIGAMVWMKQDINKRFVSVTVNGDQLRHMCSMILDHIDHLPPTVQNVIHLGLKNGKVTSDITPANLSLHQEDFEVNADKLYDKLVNGLETKKHPDISTRAYCIIVHAGLDEILDSESRHEAQKTLVRLLVNSEDDAIKRFLRDLADSIGPQVFSEV